MGGKENGTLTFTWDAGSYSYISQEFTLRHGQSITVSGLPLGAGYTVAEKEADQDGYVTSFTGTVGEISAGTPAEAVFTNTKNVRTPPTEDTPEPTPPPWRAPDIGDEGRPGMWLALMGLSLMGLGWAAPAARSHGAESAASDRYKRGTGWSMTIRCLHLSCARSDHPPIMRPVLSMSYAPSSSSSDTGTTSYPSLSSWNSVKNTSTIYAENGRYWKRSQDVKANEIRDRVHDKQDLPIADHIKPVEQLLIFLDRTGPSLSYLMPYPHHVWRRLL